MTESIIEIQSLNKLFGDIQALDGLNLQVEKGEIYGFLGPNGAGKSTAINIMLGFMKPTSGEVSINGFNPQKNPKLVRKHLGVLPENKGFYKHSTARQHLEMVGDIKGADLDIWKLLDRAGISEEDADRSVKGFSTGMKKRLGIAMAIAGNPELIILDEPLSGLDPEGANLVREIVRQENSRGATIFFSSHIMNQVERICDRVGILNQGKLVAQGRIEEIRDSLDTTETLELKIDREIDIEKIENLENIIGVQNNRSLTIKCSTPEAKAKAINLITEMGVEIQDFKTPSKSLEKIFTLLTDSKSQK